MYRGEPSGDTTLKSPATAHKLCRARELEEEEVDVRNVQPGPRLGGLFSLQEQSMPLDYNRSAMLHEPNSPPDRIPPVQPKAMQPREEGRKKVWKVSGPANG